MVMRRIGGRNMKDTIFTLDAFIFVLSFATLVVLGICDAYRHQAMLG